MKKAAPPWLIPIVAIFVLQTTSSFMGRFIPIIAPAVSEEFGWSGSSIGYLTASNSLGSLAILVAGSTLFRQIGGMRCLQFTLILGAAAMALFMHPSVSVALAACFVMGWSTGAVNPAGSEVLQRFSPPGKRNLIFSIKQAGVPLGGVIAGLLIPLMVALAGWRPALFVCILLVFIPTLLTWRASARLDEPPAGGRQRLSLPKLQWLRTFKAPLASLTSSRDLMKISVVGSLFAVSQTCWFTFTVIYLIDRLNYSLGAAGIVFAVMQAGGVIGRVGLGWLSDYLQSTSASLAIAAVFSATTTALLGWSSPDWPLWAMVILAFVAGGSAASWNGVQIAEVARRSPANLISETAAGSSIMVGVVNMLVPAAFAAFVAATGHYDYAFTFAGLCTLMVLALLPRRARKT